MNQFIIVRNNKNDILFRVCSSPVYVEARERETKIDWLGSDSRLIHRDMSTFEWAHGFSNEFGWVLKSNKITRCKLKLRFICLKDVNKDNQDCVDFEARFCCQKNYGLRKRRAERKQDISWIKESATLLNSTNDLRNS